MTANIFKISLRIGRIVLGIPIIEKIEKCMVNIQKIHFLFVEELVLLLIKTKDGLIYKK